jgi:hypothetical protein
MNAPEMVYSACRLCTAKWFSVRRARTCPRCGSAEVTHTKATPPWCRPAGENHALEKKRKAQAGRSTLLEKQ